ncbi:MAG: phosphoribosylamine--glycine ligase [Acidobacteria bacterium]|nr:phosphoribosylamine--glycine ligase [Acidobacteriota bacterium]
MRILVVGGGGREHALAWRLAQCPSVEMVFTSPGNPGAAKIATCVPGWKPSDWLALADEHEIDLTVVGPEAPLVAGIVDLFESRGRWIFGPSAAAARLEGSKAFSKDFMNRNGIPTARSQTVTLVEAAIDAVRDFGFPVVLKADGLHAGKGVVVAQDQQQADDAIPALLADGRLVVEEFLKGEEVSFIVLSDGTNVLPLPPTQDHKPVYDDDLGPNTGGMGAYTDPCILSERQAEGIMDTIIRPTVDRMKAEGYPFSGFLYAGLMMTADGPKVLEYNARLGDPEAQPLMHRFDGDLAQVLLAAVRADLKNARTSWKPEPSVCVVLASHGYPGTPRTGEVIHGIAAAEACGATVFHAATRLSQYNTLETAGGRVLGVTASGGDLAAAIENTYNAVRQIHFDGMHYRTDIGEKGLKRYNRENMGT